MLAILIDLGFFQNQGKPGHEVQSSTLELMNGLVSLVHQQCMPDVASEAMEVSHTVMRSRWMFWVICVLHI